MKKKAPPNVPTRPQSHTLSPVPAKSEAAVDRVIVSMNRKLRHLETKYQDLVSQCQDFRRSEQSESVGELREREALQELETERDRVDAELQLLLKTRKAKLGDVEESKDMRNVRNVYEAISETLKTTQNDFLRLLHLATVSEYQAKIQATDMFVRLSDAFSVQVQKLRTSGDNRDFKNFVSEIQRLGQARQVLDLKIAEANESLRQRYSAQLQRARQRISTLRSDNILWESRLKAMSRQVYSACSSPVGTTSTFTMGELGSPVSRDSTLRLTAPSGQLARSRELRTSFRPAQSERVSLSPYSTARGVRPNDESEERRIEEIKKEVESLKSQLTASTRDRKKGLFSDPPSQSDSIDYKKKLAALTSEAKEFIKLTKDIIRPANRPEAAEALKSFTRMVNDILRDWSFSEWRRSFQRPQEWSSKYALDQANKMLESENKKLEEALALEKTRSDRLIEMVEAFKKDIQPKSAELVAKLTKEVRQLTERKQELESLAETLQGDKKRVQKEHKAVVSELHSDCEALGEELKLIRKSKAELQRSSQIREAEMKAKVNDLEREKAKTRIEIAEYVQTAASRLASQYEFLEEKLTKVRTRLIKVEDLAKQCLSDTLQRLQTITSPSPAPQEVESRLSVERDRMESVLRQNQEWTNSRLLELAGRVETAEVQEVALLEDLKRERETNAKLLLELEAGKVTQAKAAEALKLAGKYEEEMRGIVENAQEEVHILSIEIAKLRSEKGLLEEKNADMASNEAVLRAETLQLRNMLKLTEKADEIVEEISSKADRRYEVDLAAEIPGESPDSLEITALRGKCEWLERELEEKEQKLVSNAAFHNTELQKQRVQLTESLNFLESQRTALIDEVSRLKTTLPSQSAPTKDQSAEQLAKSKEMQTAKESLKAANCRQEALEREVTRLQLLREKEATASELLEKLRSELRETKEENQRLKAASSEHHLSSMEDYETRINNFRDQLKAVTASCDLLEREKTEILAASSHERDLLSSKIRILTVSIAELSQVKNQALELASQRGTEVVAWEKRYEERNSQYEQLCSSLLALTKHTQESSTVEQALASLSLWVQSGKGEIAAGGKEGKSSDICTGDKDYCGVKQAYEELAGKHAALQKDWQGALDQCATAKSEADQAKAAFARLEDDYFNLKIQHSGQLTQLQTDFSRQLASQSRPSSLTPTKATYVQALPDFRLNQISIESEGSEEESVQDQVQDMIPDPGDVVKTVEYDGIAWNLICSGEKVYQWLRLDGAETPSERDTSVMEKLRRLLEPVCAEGISVEDGVAALVLEVTEIRRKKSTGSPIFPRNRGSNLASQFAYLEKGFSSPDLSDRREDLNSFELGEGQLGLPVPATFGLSSREPGSGRSDHLRDEQIGKYLQMVNDLRDEVKTLKLALASEQSDNKRLEEMMHVLRDELRLTGTKGKAQGESLLPHIRTAIVGLAVELPKLTVKGEGLLSTIYSHLELSAKQVALIEQGRKGKKADKAGVVAQVLN